MGMRFSVQEIGREIYDLTMKGTEDVPSFFNFTVINSMRKF